MQSGKQLFLAACAAAALLWAAVPAEAQRGGWHGGGWHGGWHGGYGGYRGYYHGGYGRYYYPRYYSYGWPGYGWGYPGLGIGLGAYSYGYSPGYYAYGGYAPSYNYYYDYPYYYSGTAPVYVEPSSAPAVAASGAMSGSSTREALYYAPPTDNTASIRVRLPADATLLVDGVATTKTGPDRVFASPSLTPGSTYSYQLTARWTEGGRPVEQTRKVRVRANETTDVTFGPES
jgi:uncharacterized protein (TIGR03000 family)